ncbi:MAG: GNAT family N-acetyltransferase [bacterium]
MSQIDIVQVESRSQLNQFIAYPNRLYKGDPHYVAPLTMERKAFFGFDKNPFYKTARVKLFLAFENRRIAGRIATCVNFTHNECHSEKTGFFGFFDCEDNYDVASKLLKVAMIELKREGMEKMRGPANFSTNHECGFLVDGFDMPPMVMMTYNRPYLPRLAEKFGLKKGMDLLAYRMTSKQSFPERITKMVDRVRTRSGVTIRPINMRNFRSEVAEIRQIYNQAWENNWGFVPMTEEEFKHMAKDLKQVVDPELVLIAEHEGKPVAFAMAIPDINQALIKLNGKLLPFGMLKLLWHTKIRNKVNSFRVVTLGVIPEYQKRGIDAWLYWTLYHRGTEIGYTWAEFSWILESNELMRRGLEQLGSEIYKRYRLVEMPI